MQKVKMIGKIIIGIIIILGIIALDRQYTKTNYDRCIRSGQEERICKEVLK